MQNNPYSTPSADLASHGDVLPHDKKWYSLSGRIGRLRYLAYNSIFVLFFILVGILAAILLPMMMSGGSSVLMIVAGLVGVILAIVMTVLSFAFMVRRLNDTGRTGWLSLLIFVPLLNFALLLYLIFAKGTEGMNQYGAPAKDNHIGIYIGAAVYGLFIFGYFAMLPSALTQYGEYVEMSQQAAQAAESAYP